MRMTANLLQLCCTAPLLLHSGQCCAKPSRFEAVEYNTEDGVGQTHLGWFALLP